MLRGIRILYPPGPSRTGEGTGIRVEGYTTVWVVKAAIGAQRMAQLPERWTVALASFERKEYGDGVCWITGDANQLRAFVSAMGVDRWLSTQPQSASLSMILGVTVGDRFEAITEVLSGSWSNHPHHSMWDDNYSFSAERWLRESAETVRVVQRHQRGSDATKETHHWYQRDADTGEWQVVEAPELDGWTLVEHLP